jgi:hypothetical protein
MRRLPARTGPDERGLAQAGSAAVGLPYATINWHNRPTGVDVCQGQCILGADGPVWIGSLSATDA